MSTRKSKRIKIRNDDEIELMDQQSTTIDQNASKINGDMNNQESSTIQDLNNQNQTTNLILQRCTKDWIMSRLNDFTALLHGDTIDNKEEMIKNNNGLILELSNMPFLDQHDSTNESNSSSKQKLVLDIDHAIRLKIIESLIKNVNYTISRNIANEAKKNQIKENKRLMNVIIDLSVRFIECYANDHSNSSFSNRGNLNFQNPLMIKLNINKLNNFSFF